jgi:thiol:disulfide interchange protein DsbD
MRLFLFITIIFLSHISCNGGFSFSKKPKHLCGEPIYSEIFSKDTNLHSYFEYNQALECAKEHKKPLLIYFTAYGSVGVEKLEQNILISKKVQQLLQKKFIVATLFVDSPVRLPREEWIPSEIIKNAIITTIGGVNSELQITNFQSGSQPYMMILDNNETEILGRVYHVKTINNFLEWLNQGYENFTQTKY